MSIKYFVYQTQLQNQTQFLARVRIKDTYDQEKLIQRMLERGTSMTKTDIKAVMELLVTTIQTVCQEGSKVLIEGLVNITPVIKGKFDNLKDEFKKDRNTFALSAQINQELKTQIESGAGLEKLDTDLNRPILVQVKNSWGIDNEVKPGSIAGIFGSSLKIHRFKGEYLHLVNQENHQDFVDISEVYKSTDRELTFILPEVVGFTKGYFEVGGKLRTKTLRKGVSKPLVILEIGA